MNLFDRHKQGILTNAAPLAARMRPTTLEEFIGQDHILGQGRLLRRAIQADQMSSLIFFGPPGTGKTTLAKIIANTTKSHFIEMNAVLSGIKDIKESISIAEEHLRYSGQRTILFVDEVHRFNKSQQDALLPHVENGTVILVGATTENPYFEVNKALVSRSRIFQLKSLEEADLKQIIYQAMKDVKRGFGNRVIELTQEALEHLVQVCNGDARSLLNAFELAVETTPGNEQGIVCISREVAEESIQKKAVLYDKDGDAHYDTISAFIKSVRGSDPDAALYWLAKMVYAGEDPRFIFRRMLILAAEDVGLADPQAIVVVNAAAQAYDYVGLPEGQFHLSQAVLYLSTCPKSNTTLSYFDALESVKSEQNGDVPNHLKDGNRDKDGFGHGIGYQYPHAFREHWVEQQYLPDVLKGKTFYQPSLMGYEKRIRDQLLKQRELQMMASIDAQLVQTKTFIPTGHDWAQRPGSEAGKDLMEFRKEFVTALAIKPDDFILDLRFGVGVVTWELLRHIKHQNIVSLASSESEKSLFDHYQRNYENSPLVDLLLTKRGRVIGQFDKIQDDSSSLLMFDKIIGYKSFSVWNYQDFLEDLTVLCPQGPILLRDMLPLKEQRPSALLPQGVVGGDLFNRIKEAEEKIFSQMKNSNCFNELHYRNSLSKLETHVPEESVIQVCEEVKLTKQFIDRLFKGGQNGKASYGDQLKQWLALEEILEYEKIFKNTLLGKFVNWQHYYFQLLLKPKNVSK